VTAAIHKEVNQLRTLDMCAMALLAALLSVAAPAHAAWPQTAEYTVPWTGVYCTSFMASSKGLSLLGDSEDAGMDHPLAGDPCRSLVFFRPASSEEYGRMHLGWLWQGKYRSFQAGMNEHGLAYSLTAVPEVQMKRHPERPFLHGRDSFYDRILRQAANVEEAIKVTLQFDFPSVWFQILFADASGNAAVISPSADGELSITRKDEGSHVLVASTFNVADPDQFVGHDSFVRYDAAREKLEQLTLQENLDVKPFASVLQAVSRQHPYVLDGSYTMYSTTYDLTHRQAFIYFLSGFKDPVVIDLPSELFMGEHTLAVCDLVSGQSIENARARYWSVQGGGLLGLLVAVGLIASATIAVILVLLR